LAGVLQACSGIPTEIEIPTVTVNSFRTLPSDGALPDFEIGLHVINPNRVPLPLRGVAYTISLNDYELIKGVGNDLPVIDAYGEDTLTLTASPNLFAGIRFITELMGASQESVRYEIEAKLDVGTFLPPIRVSDSGEISLRPATSN
jgi:LEA14-like dessication related protein